MLLTCCSCPKEDEVSRSVERDASSQPDPKKLAQGSPQPSQTMDDPGTLPLMGGIGNSAMTPSIEPRLEETSFSLPHRTPKNWRRGLPSPFRLWMTQVSSPLWVGIGNSAMTPNIEPRLEETSFSLPHRTPKNWRRGLPSPVRLWIAQVPSPLWMGIRNSALTTHIEPRLEETSFTLPHRTPKPQKTTAPDPKKLAQGSPQPSQTMDDPGAFPLMGGHR